MNPILSFGIQLIQALQTLSPALDVPMRFFTFLGTIEFYILIIPVFYWLVDSQLGFRILLALLSTDILGTAFKQLLHQPRPYWVGDVKAMGDEISYGIPSTHASDSLTVWGVFAYQMKKNWLWAASAALVFLISLSRLYLGVHFPQDVLGGWLIGAFVLYMLIKLEPSILSWLKNVSQLTQIGIAFGISVLVILVGLLVGLAIASTPDPAEWAQYATQARSPSHYYTLGGVFFGAASGFVLMWHRARFGTQGSGIQKAGRYLLGIAGVLVIYMGLDAVFSLIAADETAAGYLLRYIRYASLAFWMTFGAPWAFLKLKLAHK